MSHATTTLPRKKLPIGIQTFSVIRQDGYYYVDKTALVLRLIEQGKHYFLSRPRRFGKSLLLDTIAELFQARRELFTGLDADLHWDWSQSYPVVRISFAAGVVQNTEELQVRIAEQLRTQIQHWGLSLAPDLDNAGQWGQLLCQLHARTGQPVVVLVDEYDKPVLDNITSPEMARQMCDGLRALYSVIEQEDAHIRFVLLTGVSKFSKIPLLSGLKQLQDISFDPRYSALCGYTDEEVDTVFAPELPGLDREQIRHWYGGYHWMGTHTYNPHCLLVHWSNRGRPVSWFENGTPSFLIRLLSQRSDWIPPLGLCQVSLDDWNSDALDALPLETLLLETGYMTLDSSTTPNHAQTHRLRYVNQNTHSSLLSYFLQQLLLPHAGDFYRACLAVGKQLRAEQLLTMHEPMEHVLAELCSSWQRSKPIDALDRYWNILFCAMFADIGFDCIVEDAIYQGHINMAVLFNRNVYLFEFKVVELVPQGKVLEQTVQRGYAEKYRSRGEPIHLSGVEFSKEKRSIVGFEVETL